MRIENNNEQDPFFFRENQPFYTLAAMTTKYKFMYIFRKFSVVGAMLSLWELCGGWKRKHETCGFNLDLKLFLHTFHNSNLA
jgi:hypothetical protein